MGRPSRKQEGRLEILEAAASVIAKRGFHGMSMRDLAESLNKTPAGFYNYYPSKEELLFDLQKRAFDALVQSALEAIAHVDTPEEQLYAFIVQHVQYVASHHAVMQVLIQEAHALPQKHRRAVRDAKQRYYDVGRRVLADAIRVRAPRRAVDDDELERQTYAMFGMLNWTYGWYRPHQHGAPAQLAGTLHRLLLSGLHADATVASVVDDVNDKLADIKPQPLLAARATPAVAAQGRSESI